MHCIPLLEPWARAKEIRAKIWKRNCSDFGAVESLKSTPTREDWRETPSYSCSGRYFCKSIFVWTEFHLFASKAHDLRRVAARFGRGCARHTQLQLCARDGSSGDRLSGGGLFLRPKGQHYQPRANDDLAEQWDRPDEHYQDRDQRKLQSNEQLRSVSGGRCELQRCG